MFTPILLLCTIDHNICWGQASSMIFKTEEECHTALAKGIEIYEEKNFIIEDYHCVQWGKKT